MLEQIARFGTITLIALMVWLYAEGATRRQQEQSFRVNFVPAPGQDLIIEPSTLSIRMYVRCASSQAEQLRRDADKPISIEISDVPGLHTQQVYYQQSLAVNDRMNRLGVTIDRVDPTWSEVRVDRLAERKLPIVLVTPPDLELAAPATFDVEQATIKLPASRVSDLEGLTLSAPLDRNQLAGVVPGVPTERDVVVSLPPVLAAAGATFTPDKVKVTFVVKKKEDEFTLSLVPVVLNIAPKQARLYDVLVDQENQSLRDVKVKGPSDAIARIKSGQVRVEALLRLDPEDLEKNIPSKLPELRLPAGVTVESTLPLVKLTITKRESVPPAPGG